MNSSNPLGGPVASTIKNPLNPLADPLGGLTISKPAPKKEPVEEQMKPLSEGFKNSYIEKLCTCQEMVQELENN